MAEQQNPRTWRELLSRWNSGLRDIGNPANAFKTPEPLPEPGLIDVSGGLSGFGSKMMSAKLAATPKKALHINPEFAHLFEVSPALKARELAKLRTINNIKSNSRAMNVAAASAFNAPDIYSLHKETR